MQQQFTSIFLMVAPNLQPQNQNLIDTWLSLWYKMVNSCTHNSHNLYKWNLAIVRIFSTCLTFLRIAFRISSHQQTQLYQFHGGFQVFFTGLMMRYTESNVLVVSAASFFFVQQSGITEDVILQLSNSKVRFQDNPLLRSLRVVC